VVSPTEITGATPAATSPGAQDVVVTSNSHGRGTCSGCLSYKRIGVIAQPLAAGFRHTCALTGSEAALCWGFNTSAGSATGRRRNGGQLGNGATASSNVPVRVAGQL